MSNKLKLLLAIDVLLTVKFLLSLLQWVSLVNYACVHSNKIKRSKAFNPFWNFFQNVGLRRYPMKLTIEQKINQRDLVIKAKNRKMFLAKMREMGYKTPHGGIHQSEYYHIMTKDDYELVITKISGAKFCPYFYKGGKLIWTLY